MGEMETFVVPDERAGLELDEFLCLQYPGLSKGFLRQEIGAGRVLLDGAATMAGKRLRSSQVIMATIDWERAPKRPESPGIEVPVLFESESVLVVDKPAGLAVEPERWMRELGSLAGALLQLAEDRTVELAGEPGVETAGSDKAPSAGLAFRPRLVHRIDKDTTGAILVAKTIEAERTLREAFSSGTITKSYLALVEGEPYLDDDETLIIDEPIGPVLKKSGRMRIAPDGKPSQTRMAIAERFDGYTLLRCQPITGRTHQIRVHMAHEGFPLVVDAFYGRRTEFKLSEFKPGYRPKRGRPEKPLMDRLALHAHEIELSAEVTRKLDLAGGETGAAKGEPFRVTAPIPKDLERLLKQLRKVRPPR